MGVIIRRYTGVVSNPAVGKNCSFCNVHVSQHEKDNTNKINHDIDLAQTGFS